MVLPETNNDEELYSIIKKKVSINNIQTDPGIYFLLEKQEIVYIGQSMRPYTRVTSHAQEEKIKFDSYHITPCEEDKLDEKESHYIFKYAPKYNKRMNCQKHPHIHYICQIEDTENKNRKLRLTALIIGNRLYVDILNKNFTPAQWGVSGRIK